MSEISVAEEKYAWVVFTNQSDLPILRVLKKNYRHCFVIMNDGNRWLSIDPMANYIDISIHDLPMGFDLPNWLEKNGHKVKKAKLNHNIKKCAPVMIFTCVEVCKRILGIHNRFILTPWQLYRYLGNNN